MFSVPITSPIAKLHSSIFTAESTLTPWRRVRKSKLPEAAMPWYKPGADAPVCLKKTTLPSQTNLVNNIKEKDRKKIRKGSLTEATALTLKPHAHPNNHTGSEREEREREEERIERERERERERREWIWWNYILLMTSIVLIVSVHAKPSHTSDNDASVIQSVDHEYYVSSNIMWHQ